MPSPTNDLDVRDPFGLQVEARGYGQLRDAFDAEDATGEPGQQSRLVAVTGADLEDRVIGPRSRDSIISAISDGCEVVWSCPIGIA